ncbi:hypothetical protein J6590_034357 [Homalodisca vitripennis]|nr:hypothetical protein J6590_034357 [Homalodisca vitripennis]
MPRQATLALARVVAIGGNAMTTRSRNLLPFTLFCVPSGNVIQIRRFLIRGLKGPAEEAPTGCPAGWGVAIRDNPLLIPLISLTVDAVRGKSGRFSVIAEDSDTV